MGHGDRPARRPRRAGARRTAVAALAGTLLFATTGCQPDQLNAMVEGYVSGADATSLNSGTNGSSIRLVDGRTVVLVNDAYVGPVDANGERTGDQRVANALVVHASDDQDDTYETLKGTTARGHLVPATAGNTFTLLSAWAASGGTQPDVQVFAVEKTATGATVGTRMIRLLQSNLAPTGAPVNLPAGARWGAALVQHDGYWYVIGEGTAAISTYLARAAVGQLSTTSSWRFWTGTSWSASSSAAGPLRDGAGAVVPQYLTPAWDPVRAQFAFLGRGSSSGGTFRWYAAADPQGPLTAGATASTAPEAGQACGTSGSGRVQDLRYHPHLTGEDDDVWSYSVTCTTPTTTVDEVQPRFFAAPLTAAPAAPAWRASWATSQRQAIPAFAFDQGFADQTLRQITHLTRGGTELRVRISNRFGTVPLVVGDASFAVSTEAAGQGPAVTATPVPIRFGGSDTVTIPVGQSIVSDVVAPSSPVPDDHDVAISLYFPNGTGIPTAHQFQHETSWVGGSNITHSVAGAAFGASTTSSYFVAGVDVVDATTPGVVVGLGDSMTDGYGGTVDDGQQRWTDVLFDRLETTTTTRTVVNAGVAGTRLLGGSGSLSAQDRLARDVLEQPGVRTVVIWMGHNDITGTSATASALLAGLEGLVDRSHAAGVRVVVATVTPLWGPGDTVPATSTMEDRRVALNASIRANAMGADAVVDFDAAVRDPAQPKRLRASYSFFGGNHVSSAGQIVLAERLVAIRTQL